MVKEVVATAFACEKCGKRSFRRSETVEHEKSCGMGINIKVRDKFVMSWSGRFDLAICTGISAKTLYYRYPQEADHVVHEAIGDQSYRIYDETVYGQIQQLEAQSHKLELEAAELHKQAWEIYRSMKPVWDAVK
jgi:ribosomal protein L37E